jgi:hypothetical protein
MKWRFFFSTRDSKASRQAPEQKALKKTKKKKPDNEGPSKQPDKESLPRRKPKESNETNKRSRSRSCHHEEEEKQELEWALTSMDMKQMEQEMNEIRKQIAAEIEEFNRKAGMAVEAESKAFWRQKDSPMVLFLEQEFEKMAACYLDPYICTYECLDAFSDEVKELQQFVDLHLLILSKTIRKAIRHHGLLPIESRFPSSLISNRTPRTRTFLV